MWLTPGSNNKCFVVGLIACVFYFVWSMKHLKHGCCYCCYVIVILIVHCCCHFCCEVVFVVRLLPLLLLRYCLVRSSLPPSKASYDLPRLGYDTHFVTTSCQAQSVSCCMPRRRRSSSAPGHHLCARVLERKTLCCCSADTGSAAGDLMRLALLSLFGSGNQPGGSRP